MKKSFLFENAVAFDTMVYSFILLSLYARHYPFVSIFVPISLGFALSIF